MRSTKYIPNPKGIPGKHGAQGSLHMSRDDATLMSERYRSVAALICAKMQAHVGC